MVRCDARPKQSPRLGTDPSKTLQATAVDGTTHLPQQTNAVPAAPAWSQLHRAYQRLCASPLTVGGPPTQHGESLTASNDKTWYNAVVLSSKRRSGPSCSPSEHDTAGATATGAHERRAHTSWSGKSTRQARQRHHRALTSPANRRATRQRDQRAAACGDNNAATRDPGMA